jgi:flagellin-like protein
METDSRAVSPVVSVILTVAITILLAAVVSAFVLSLGDGTSEEGPSVSLSVEQEGDQLMVTHAAGDTINTSDLRLTGMKGWGPSAQEFTGGDRISGTPAPGTDRVDIVFQTEDSSSILRTVDVSNMEVSSLVVNDGFERGSGIDAESWEQAPNRVNFEDEVERTDERSLSGEYSIKQIDLTVSYARGIISKPVDVSAGESYNFGGSYYLSNPGSGVATDYGYFIEIVWLGSSGSKIGDEPGTGKQFTKFGQWTEASFTEPAPPKAAAAKLKIRADEDQNNDADVYWDEIFINSAN